MTTESAQAIVKAEPPTAIVPDRPPTTALASMEQITQIKALAEMALGGGSDMLPRNIKTPGQAAAIMLAGYELGLRPFTALRHVYIVGGKTEIEARAMVGIIRARDPRITFEWPEYERDAVTCILRRPGQPPIRVRYTLADAKASGQFKPGPWTQYPRDMCYAAATKRACRLGAPDLINAIEGRTAAIEVMEGEYSVRAVTQEPAPPPADEYHNSGDEPGTPLAPEVDAATMSDAEWQSIGEQADDAAGAAETAALDDSTAAPTDEDLLSGARELLRAIVRDYAPQNVKQLMAKFAGKKTAAGNPAFTQYTRAELEQAIEAMREFVAGAARQGALDG